MNHFGLLKAQEKIDLVPVNQLLLGTTLDSIRSKLDLITGNEDIYMQYPRLKESVLKNIDLGIREGIYNGSKYSFVNGVRASKATLFFYKDKLYKIRWFFYSTNYSNLRQLAKELNEFLVKKYGETNGDDFLPFNIWQGNTLFLQSFYENDEFQIEYRNSPIHDLIQMLQNEK